MVLSSYFSRRFFEYIRKRISTSAASAEPTLWNVDAAAVQTPAIADEDSFGYRLNLPDASGVGAAQYDRRRRFFSSQDKTWLKGVGQYFTFTRKSTEEDDLTLLLCCCCM